MTIRHSHDAAAACHRDMSCDEGAATVFVVVLASALLVTAGLVIDGGHALAARQEAASVAEQAARAGADALSRESIRTGGPLHVDPAAANAAVTRYLEAVGHEGHARVSGDTVSVSVRITRPAAVLSAFGIDILTVSESVTARGLTGIDRPEPPSTPAGRDTR